MNIDDDYDNDGNNIVPCPICLDVYCPSKEDGKCPQEDEFAKHYLNTPDTEWETQDAILQVFKDKYPLPSIGYDGSEQDFKERKIQYCLVKELIYRAVVSGKKSLKHLLTSRDTYWQNHEQDMYESLEKANREQTILDVARVRDERDTYWKEKIEETVRAIFSGDTIEYKGKFFKISDSDALNFVQWEQTVTNEDKTNGL